MDETKGRTNAQRSKVSSGLRFFFGVKSAVGLRFITSIVATHLHNDGGNTHTETYNLADKRSRTREGVNLQCESVKFFFAACSTFPPTFPPPLQPPLLPPLLPLFPVGSRNFIFRPTSMLAPADTRTHLRPSYAAGWLRGCVCGCA